MPITGPTSIKRISAFGRSDCNLSRTRFASAMQSEHEGCSKSSNHKRRHPFLPFLLTERERDHEDTHSMEFRQIEVHGNSLYICRTREGYSNTSHSRSCSVYSPEFGGIFPSSYQHEVLAMEACRGGNRLEHSPEIPNHPVDSAQCPDDCQYSHSGAFQRCSYSQNTYKVRYQTFSKHNVRVCRRIPVSFA